MILFFKKIRMSLIKNNRVSKYLAYSSGEIVLVVAGILIALQINNWNQNRLEQESLNAYLTSISRNIQSDLAEISILREKRHNLAIRVPFMFETAIKDNYINIQTISLLSDTTQRLFDLEFLIPDQSGFESLKNSGYLNKLRGEDLEFLIYRYYNMILEINMEEVEYNDSIKNTKKAYQGADFETAYLFHRPSFIDLENGLDEIQPLIRNIITHQSTLQTWLHAATKSPLLTARYDNLKIVGEQIISLIDKNSRTLDASGKLALEHIYDFNSGEGYAKVLENGSMNESFYIAGFSQSAELEDFRHVYRDNALEIRFKEMDWGVTYITPTSDITPISEDSLRKPTRDYSKFTSLRVEARTMTPGKEMIIVIKDSEDPDDGSETRFPLALALEWQTFDIPLTEFKTADLSHLNLVVGFLFLGEEQTVQIRTVEYLK
jgi:hypothetical protein